MPYLGRVDGEEVIPPQVQDDTDLYCPKCRKGLSVVSSHRRNGAFISRHFRHTHSSECSGESDTHLKWKSIAYSKLEDRYPDADVQLEEMVGDRRADILVEFRSQTVSKGLGTGICVEIQHKHEGKDRDAVTQEFISNGYSVLWLSEEHFCGKDVYLDSGEWIRWWVHQVPPVAYWSGYHGVVHWLRQTNYASVELEIPVLFDVGKVIDDWDIKSAWLRGVKQRTNDEVPIRYPCANCGSLVTGFAPASYRLNPKEHYHTSSYWMDLVFSGHECSHCGRFNKIHRHAVRMVSYFDPNSVRWNNSKEFDPTSELHLPCMQCGAALVFEARMDPVSSSTGKKMELTVEETVECSECGSVIEAYHDGIWITASNK